ncbi:hypothetical protein VST35_01565, partial [Pseudomonas aeruginosa]
MSLHLKPGQLTLADLRQAYLAPVRLSLDPSADALIAASVACVVHTTSPPHPPPHPLLTGSGNIMPPGTYKFEAQTSIDGKTYGLQTYLPANVDSVTLGQNG